MRFQCFPMSYKHNKTWGHPYRALPLASNCVYKFIIGTENKNNDKNITQFLILTCKKKQLGGKNSLSE